MKEFCFTVDEFTVHLYCADLDAKLLLLEAQRRGVSLGGPYSAQYHTARVLPGQKHVHVYHKNNQLFALNADGTAHDKSHGVSIPNRVAREIQRLFPDIQVPADGIIEGTSAEDVSLLLLECRTEAGE